MLRTVLTVVFLLWLVLGSVSCAAPRPPAASGFMHEYDTLRPDRRNERTLIQPPQPGELRRYDSLIVDRVRVVLQEDARGEKYKPEDLQKLGDYFGEQLVTRLGRDYRIVADPGPNTLRLRAAITDARGGFALMNVHWATKVLGSGVGGAAAEIEAVDSTTDRRVFAWMDARRGNRMAPFQGLTKWGNARWVAEEWSREIAKRMRYWKGQKAKRKKQ